MAKTSNCLPKTHPISKLSFSLIDQIAFSASQDSSEEDHEEDQRYSYQ